MMERERTAIYAAQLGRFLQLETVSQGRDDGGFPDVLPFLRREFPRLFQVLETEEFGGSLLLHWMGRHREKKPFLLMSHHDVVPAEGEWRYPPFSGAQEENLVWGRGALDTKGNLWAMLRGAEELVEEGFQPARDIYFVSTCNEETTGGGADIISRVLEERGVRLAMTLDEGGMIVRDLLPGVKTPFAMVGVGKRAVPI